jgi:hypothetical protein
MGKSKDTTEVDGNAMMSAKLFAEQTIKAAETLIRVERSLDRLFEKEVYVEGVTIRCPTEEKPGYLAIVRAVTPAGRMVAFHREETFWEVVVGVAKRLENGSLKWAEDRYG